MDWFYARNGEQAGPVPEAQLDELLRTGIITGDTLVWHVGMDNWQPLRAARAPQPPPVLPSQGATQCAECHRPFPQSEMVFLQQNWICAQCKPVFLQRLREGVAPVGGNLWRSGKQVVLRRNAALPDRCVKCNAPAHGIRLKRQLSWHPSAWYLLIFVGLLIYVIVALIVRKQAVVQLPLCEAHRARRRWIITTCWLAFLGGIALIILGANQAAGGGWIIVTGIVAILAGAFGGALLAPPVTPARIDSDFVWLRGAGREFLDTLPTWNDPR